MIKELIKDVIIALCVVFLVTSFIKPTVVKGESVNHPPLKL